MTNAAGLIVIGGGGHAKVVTSAAQQAGFDVLGFVAPKSSPEFLGISWLGDDQILEQYRSEDVMLLNGVGSTRDCELRKNIYTNLKKKALRLQL